MKSLIALLGVVALASMVAAVGTSEVKSDPDEEAIREVVGSAYIRGLHLNGSREDIRAGFHPEFVMSVRSDEGVQKVSIEEWIGRLPPAGQKVDREVTFEVPTVTRTGDAAVATVQVYFDGRHVFTDYMGLYRFSEGWRIVNKIFQSH